MHIILYLQSPANLFLKWVIVTRQHHMKSKESGTAFNNENHLLVTERQYRKVGRTNAALSTIGNVIRRHHLPDTTQTLVK